MTIFEWLNVFSLFLIIAFLVGGRFYPMAFVRLFPRKWLENMEIPLSRRKIDPATIPANQLKRVAGIVSDLQSVGFEAIEYQTLDSVSSVRPLWVLLVNRKTGDSALITDVGEITIMFRRPHICFNSRFSDETMLRTDNVEFIDGYYAIGRLRSYHFSMVADAKRLFYLHQFLIGKTVSEKTKLFPVEGQEQQWQDDLAQKAAWDQGYTIEGVKPGKHRISSSALEEMLKQAGTRLRPAQKERDKAEMLEIIRLAGV